jgi:hypothetical protein
VHAVHQMNGADLQLQSGSAPLLLHFDTKDTLGARRYGNYGIHVSMVWLSCGLSFLPHEAVNDGFLRL